MPFGTPWPSRRWRLSRRACALGASLIAVLVVSLFGFGYPGDLGCRSDELYNAWAGLTLDDIRAHKSNSLTVHVVGTDAADGLHAGQITDISTCRPAGTRTFADLYVRVAK